MSKRNFALTYFLTRSFILGYVFSLLFNTSGIDSIFSIIIGTIIGLIFITIFHKFKLNNLVRVLLCLIFIMMETVSLEYFVSSFFLTSTPKIMIIIPTIFLTLYLANKNIDVIKKNSIILFIVSIILFLFISLSLINYIDVSNALPLFTKSPINILKSALIYATFTSSPQVLLQDENITLKEHLLYFLICSLTNAIICFIIITSLTIEVSKLYSFPEYMILKRIKISEFVQNIENITASIYFLDIFHNLTLSFYNIKKIINKNFIYYPLIIITIILTTYFIASNYYIVLLIYKNIYLIILSLFILGLIKFKK